MNLSGWIPSRFLHTDEGARVQWTLLGEQRLLDPFYEQTMQRQMRQPFHQLFRRETSMEEMMTWVEEHPPLPLKGLIFHMSRCGSTLISQMLAASNRHVVASEPAPLDGVLRAHLRDATLARETQVRWVRGMAGALGQARQGGEKAFFAKLDCWHVHQVELLREAFPDVPFLFLYRDPVEVMVSHGSMPAAWTVPGMLHPLALRLRREDWNPAQTDVYRALALAHICEGGLQVAEQYGGLLVNYSELPNALFGNVFRHFQLSLEDIPVMLEQSHRNAKSPQERFLGDRELKQAAATERMREVTAEYLEPIYQLLEARRMRSPRAPA